MKVQLVEDWRIEERRQVVSQRGLNAWPHDQPDDLKQIEQIGEWLESQPVPVVLQHPLHPLKMLVGKDFSPRMAYYFALGDYEEADLELIGYWSAAAAPASLDRLRLAAREIR